MELINFVNPNSSEDDMKAYNTLVHCSCAGFGFEQTTQLLRNINYYVPEDLYTAFTTVQDIAMNLDIGPRRVEVK